MMKWVLLLFFSVVPFLVQAITSTSSSSTTTTKTIVLDVDDADGVVNIQIASDLHLEFYNNNGNTTTLPNNIIEPQAPILALLGDVGLSFTETLRSFLLQQSDRFQYVFFVAGNHEFYNSPNSKYTVQEQLSWIRLVCSERENLIFLEKQALDVNGVVLRILGTTLWSFVPPETMQVASNGLNDYRLSHVLDEHNNGKIRSMTPKDTNTWFHENVEWLKMEIERAKREKKTVVVLTHHTPCLTGTSDPKYDGSSLSACFSSNLVDLLVDPVVLWACGHTHYNFDMTFPSDHNSVATKTTTTTTTTRLVSNQRGYPHSTKPDYDNKGIVIQLTL